MKFWQEAKSIRQNLLNLEKDHKRIERMEKQIAQLKAANANIEAKWQELLRYADDYFAFSGMTDTDRRYKASEALDRLMAMDGIETVLDVGSGAGIHSAIFAANGKKVTAIDYGKSPVFKPDPNIRQIIDDFNTHDFGGEQFDCVWCCHVLEHQPNPGDFLKRLHSLTREGGYLAVTVPPLKQRIVGGHLTLWNAGLLLVHLVEAGFDCSQAHVKAYGYNVSVIVRKHTVDVSGRLCYDSGDIAAISEYLPKELEWHPSANDMEFMGAIRELNWWEDESGND